MVDCVVQKIIKHRIDIVVGGCVCLLLTKNWRKKVSHYIRVVESQIEYHLRTIHKQLTHFRVSRGPGSQVDVLRVPMSRARLSILISSKVKGDICTPVLWVRGIIILVSPTLYQERSVGSDLSPRTVLRSAGVVKLRLKTPNNTFL